MTITAVGVHTDALGRSRTAPPRSGMMLLAGVAIVGAALAAISPTANSSSCVRGTAHPALRATCSPPNLKDASTLRILDPVGVGR